MFQYIAKRLIQLIPVIIGITFITFMLFLVVPGNPFRMSLGQHPDPEIQAQIEREYGMDLPWPTRYGKFLWKAVQGDLGKSIQTEQPVTRVIADAFPATLKLTVSAMLFAVLLGIPAGIVSATRQYSTTDNIFMFLALVGVSTPIFVLGLILQLVFIRYFSIIPGVGYGTKGFMDSFYHLILPTIALGTIPLAMISRMTRSTLLEQMNSDHVRTARAKGVQELAVVYKHALKNALIPIVTVIGNYFAMLMAGAIITEKVFSWPGLGSVMISAIEKRDMPVVMGSVLVLAMIFVLTNIIVDISYAYIDPRVRLK
jgi:peptide/nickel transport system permease protein